MCLQSLKKQYSWGFYRAWKSDSTEEEKVQCMKKRLKIKSISNYVQFDGTRTSTANWLHYHLELDYISTCYDEKEVWRQ